MLQSQDTNPSHRRLLHSLRDFSADHPPLLVPVYGLPKQVEDAVGIITIAAANTANDMLRNQSNTVYIYAYNRLFANNMRNKDWSVYIEACVMHTWVNVQSNQFDDTIEAINDACAAVFMTYACFMAFNTAQFGSILNTTMRNEVASSASNWQQFTEAYDELLAQQAAAAGQETVNGTNRIRASDMGFRRPGQSEVTNRSSMQPVTRRATRQITDVGNGMQTQNVVQQHRRNAYAPQQQQAPKRAVGRRVQYAFVPLPQGQQQATQAEKPETNFGGKVVEMVGGEYSERMLGQQSNGLTLADWRPSHHQRFHPALKMGRDVIYDRAQLANGSPAVIAIISESNDMDASDHVISTAGNLFRTALTNRAPAESIKPEVALSEIGKAIATGGVGENEKATETYRALGVSAEQLQTGLEPSDSIQGLIAKARRARLFNDKEGRGQAYIASGSIVTSFVTRDSIGSPFNALAENLTFAEVAEKMRGYLEQELTIDEMAAVLQLDKYLHNMVLTFVRLHMGQPQFRFDSFMDEVDGVYQAIESAYGKSYAQYFAVSEPALIQMALSEHALDEAILENHVETPSETEGGDPTMTSEQVGHHLSISRYVNCLLLDLSLESFGVDTPPGYPCQVFPESFQGLYGLCESVFTSKGTNKLEVHYIVLADNTVFELACSDVATQSNGKPIYVIRRMAA